MSAARNRSAASTTFSWTPVAATKSFSTCSVSPLRIRPWSTYTQVSWDPMAFWTRAAATAESTPPERPQMARRSPTCSRMAATCSSMTLPVVQSGLRPAPRYRKCSSTCCPYVECMTSGWYWTP
ncbi:hypothetical protein SHIRM173S_12174 [Streptomyces hirsutus]